MPEELQFIRAIKGAPATVLLLLMVRGAAMTNAEISRWTGYSDKPVAGALAVLEQMRLIQFNGRAAGWSLSSGNQLALPFAAQSELVSAAHPPSISAPAPDRDPSGDSLKKLSTDPAEVGKFPTSSRKISDFRAGSAAAADLRSALEISDQQQQQHGGSQKISDLRLLVVHSSIRQPARDLVLASDPATVLAWWWSSLVDAAEMENPLGWFIRRLQMGDAPPADLVAIATVWLSLPAARRRDLAQASYHEAETIWFDLGLGPTSAELAYEVARAGGFEYGDW